MSSDHPTGTEVYSLPFDNYANKPKVVKRQSLDYSRSYFGSSVGSQVDSAMSWRYRLTYIFSGRHYLKYDDITKRVSQDFYGGALGQTWRDNLGGKSG